MAQLTLAIGNRNYSSWSLRAWIALKHLGVDFTEIVIPLDQSGTHEEIDRYGPSGRVPVLRAGELAVWDSLAICEYAAELTGRGWPRAREARALARSIDCRHRFGAGGPWLFGADYTIADAMYAPVVLRFNTYGARVSDTARWYMATVLEDAALQEWLRAARAETP